MPGARLRKRQGFPRPVGETDHNQDEQDALDDPADGEVLRKAQPRAWGSRHHGCPGPVSHRLESLKSRATKRKPGASDHPLTRRPSLLLTLLACAERLPQRELLGEDFR